MHLLGAGKEVLENAELGHRVDAGAIQTLEYS